jgi:hypothetical protein
MILSDRLLPLVLLAFALLPAGCGRADLDAPDGRADWGDPDAAAEHIKSYCKKVVDACIIGSGYPYKHAEPFTCEGLAWHHRKYSLEYGCEVEFDVYIECLDKYPCGGIGLNDDPDCGRSASEFYECVEASELYSDFVCRFASRRLLECTGLTLSRRPCGLSMCDALCFANASCEDFEGQDWLAPDPSTRFGACEQQCKAPPP